MQALNIDYLTLARKNAVDAVALFGLPPGSPGCQEKDTDMRDEQSVPISAEVCNTALESNKKTVLDFIEKAVNQGDIDAAFAHFGEKYVQHNPNIADGIEGFRHYLQQLRQAFPLVRAEVKRIFADSDFVIVHMHAKREPEEVGLAIVDFFRLAAGKIIEHWEVRQPVEESVLHANSML